MSDIEAIGEYGSIIQCPFQSADEEDSADYGLESIPA